MIITSINQRVMGPAPSNARVMRPAPSNARVMVRITHHQEWQICASCCYWDQRLTPHSPHCAKYGRKSCTLWHGSTCAPIPFPFHFNSISIPFQFHFNSISIPFLLHFNCPALFGFIRIYSYGFDGLSPREMFIIVFIC